MGRRDERVRLARAGRVRLCPALSLEQRPLITTTLSSSASASLSVGTSILSRTRPVRRISHHACSRFSQVGATVLFGHQIDIEPLRRSACRSCAGAGLGYSKATLQRMLDDHKKAPRSDALLSFAMSGSPVQSTLQSRRLNGPAGRQCIHSGRSFPSTMGTGDLSVQPVQVGTVVQSAQRF